MVYIWNLKTRLTARHYVESDLTLDKLIKGFT